MVFESVLDPVFSPLLRLQSFWAIFIISLVIALIITLVYKWMTDQNLMKTLKDDMKSFQKEMKDLKHDPKKFMEVQKKAMETNMKYMMHSMKPTLITFIPIILIFGWLNSHVAYEPIAPGTEFTVSAMFEANTKGNVELKPIDEIELVSDAEQEISCFTEKGIIFSSEVCKAEWTLKGDAGNYLLEYDYDGKSYKQDLIITDQVGKYAPVSKAIKDSRLRSLEIGNEKVKPIPGIGLGWLGTYIILSIVFSIGLRKIMKLH